MYTHVQVHVHVYMLTYNVHTTQYTHFYQCNKHIMYMYILILYIYTCLHAVYTQKHIYMMSQVNNDILIDIIHVY